MILNMFRKGLDFRKINENYLTDTGPKGKVRHRTVCPLRGHFAPRLFLLRFSFFDRNSSARIRMALKALHSPVSVNLQAVDEPYCHSKMIFYDQKRLKN